MTMPSDGPTAKAPPQLSPGGAGEGQPEWGALNFEESGYPPGIFATGISNGLL